MMRHLIATFVLVFLVVPALNAGQFTLQQDDKGVTVNLNGKLFTRYIERSGAKPILWPIIGPTGQEMTRGYPMRPATQYEKADHIHHRSFWFDHGSVNGVSFWAEDGKNGTIVHRKFLELKDGDEAIIRTKNDWIMPSGQKVCEDVRRLVFGANDKIRWIDFDVTVTATADKVVFGDTKEGSFGMRVAGSMRVERNAGGKIINSEGQTNKQAWGKRASWVDYSGPVYTKTGQTQRVGIAILNHPSSFRYPTYWHVRTYGLFAANPFGLHNFLGSNKYDGSLTLKRGESFSLYYRVIFHRGNDKTIDLNAAFREYSKLKKSGPQPKEGGK